ncbi:MAG: hypothetical protein ACR2IK_02725 [Chloroflexota bacterium]
MDAWPETLGADTFAVPDDREAHRLDVYLTDGRLTDVRLDGESVHPTWFKIEWKESGEVSAKVKGVKLATRFGDAIHLHQVGSA